MGSNSSQFHTQHPVFHYVLDYKYCKVWVRKSDRRQHMEEYQVRIGTPEEMDKYKAMFALRTQHEVLVNTLYFTHEVDQYMCGNSQKGSILTERIPYRLCQFKGIPHTDALPVLALLLEGYNTLYSIYGLFIVQSTMVGLDHDNKIKIWHHTDFSAVLPQNTNCYCIQSMILSLVTAVEKITFYPNNLDHFSQVIGRDMNCLNSFDGVRGVLRNYLRKYRIEGKKCFPCLDRYLREEEVKLFFVEENLSPKSVSKSKYSFREKKCVSPMGRSLRGQLSRESSVCSSDTKFPHSGVKVYGSSLSRSRQENSFAPKLDNERSKKSFTQKSSLKQKSSKQSEYFIVSHPKTRIKQSETSTSSLCSMSVLPPENPFPVENLSRRNRIGKPSIHTTQSSSFFENAKTRGQIVGVLGQKRK